VDTGTGASSIAIGRWCMSRWRSGGPGWVARVRSSWCSPVIRRPSSPRFDV
jgi:hypothetical protein